MIAGHTRAAHMEMNILDLESRPGVLLKLLEFILTIRNYRNFNAYEGRLWSNFITVKNCAAQNLPSSKIVELTNIFCFTFQRTSTAFQKNRMNIMSVTLFFKTIEQNAGMVAYCF